jgi:hypothetical protein
MEGNFILDNATTQFDNLLKDVDMCLALTTSLTSEIVVDCH